MDTKVLFIKFPQTEQLFDDFFLLGSTSKLRYEAWIFYHADGIKICAQTVRNHKYNIQNEIGGESCWRALAKQGSKTVP